MWDRYLNFNWNIYFFVVDFLYFDWRKVYNEFEIKINYCIYMYLIYYLRIIIFLFVFLYYIGNEWK